MDKNRIGGLRCRTKRQRTTKPISIKGTGGKSGGCARKAVELTSGEPRKLKVNEAKSAVARPTERKFLGFRFSSNKERIRELTRRTRGISLEQMTKELAAYLRGGKSYFGFCQTPSLLQAPEEWIRRRLRSMIWKQWKHGKQRYVKLRQLGVGKDLATQTAGSPHGPWHLAKSPTLSYALPTPYVDSLGLPRLFDGLA
jgi:RNA-directed DNA polymerase